MKCSLGCMSRWPAVVVATLKGNPSTRVSGEHGEYPLCQYHLEAIQKGTWDNVTIVGLEKLP